jgi:CBS domain-containing protein/ribosome-associated translation inhibitor RaiA
MVLLNFLAQLSVSEMIETNYPNISHSESISRLISFFHSSESYESIVTNAHPPSLVTVRDILKIRHPTRTSVSKISIKPPGISPNTLVYEASMKLVQNNIRILPVMDDDKLVGVVRQTKILEEMANCDDLRNFKSGDIMIENPVTATRDSPASVVKSLMLRKGISHTPIVDRDGKLTGIITAKDLIWQFIKPQESVKKGEKRGEKMKLLEIGIKGLSDRNPLTIPRNMLVSDVVQEMASQKKSYALVVERNKPVGIITPRDVISILGNFRPTIQIPIHVIGFRGSDNELVQSYKGKIERVARRGLKIHPDLQEIVIHGKISSIRGMKKSYSLRARASTPSGIISVTMKGWSLLDVLDELCEKLDRRLRHPKVKYPRESFSRKDITTR